VHLRARQTARATFTLEEDVKHAALVLEGQDDDSDGQTPIRITVNGREIFRGDNGFAERGWSTRMWFLPQNLLVAGKNEIVITDMAESTNPYFRWFMTSGVWIEKRAPR
jgi:hypothetical protein